MALSVRSATTAISRVATATRPSQRQMSVVVRAGQINAGIKKDVDKVQQQQRQLVARALLRATHAHWWFRGLLKHLCKFVMRMTVSPGRWGSGVLRVSLLTAAAVVCSTSTPKQLEVHGPSSTSASPQMIISIIPTLH